MELLKTNNLKNKSNKIKMFNKITIFIKNKIKK